MEQFPAYLLSYFGFGYNEHSDIMNIFGETNFLLHKHSGYNEQKCLSPRKYFGYNEHFAQIFEKIGDFYHFFRQIYYFHERNIK